MQLLKTEPRGRIDGILKFKTIFTGEVREPGIIRMLRSFGKQRISRSQDNEAYIRSVLRALKRSTWRKWGKISLYNKLVWIYKNVYALSRFRSYRVSCWIPSCLLFICPSLPCAESRLGSALSENIQLWDNCWGWWCYSIILLQLSQYHPSFHPSRDVASIIK